MMSPIQWKPRVPTRRHPQLKSTGSLDHSDPGAALCSRMNPESHQRPMLQYSCSRMLMREYHCRYSIGSRHTGQLISPISSCRSAQSAQRMPSRHVRQWTACSNGTAPMASRHMQQHLGRFALSFIGASGDSACSVGHGPSPTQISIFCALCRHPVARAGGLPQAHTRLLGNTTVRQIWS